MSLEIILVLSILGIALILFITEWVRMDIVALLVLGSLAIIGLVTPDEALEGFSNPAVVTVWAMFILSAGLYHTGVAKIIGKQVLRFAGKTESRMIIIIMLSSGVMSAFMNNIGVAALMLPVIMDVAKRTGKAPSKLLMPLAFGSLLGGLTTLIGTPPNLLISFSLLENDLTPFGLFDFTPVGLGVMIGGILFVAFIGRHILPLRDTMNLLSRNSETDLTQSYALQERVFQLRVKPGSGLSGKTLADSKLRSALGINVLAVVRAGKKLFDPDPYTELRDYDKLIVQGKPESINTLRGWKYVHLEESNPDLKLLFSPETKIIEAALQEKSSVIGKRLRDSDFRNKIEVNILAIKQDESIRRTNLQNIVLDSTSIFLLLGTTDQFNILTERGEINIVNEITYEDLKNIYRLDERLFIARISEESGLINKSIAQSQFGGAFNLNILGIMRNGKTIIMPSADEEYKPGDQLIVQGKPDDLSVLQGIYDLEEVDDPTPDLKTLESDEVRLNEVILAPRSSLAGKTLREIKFREKYGVTVIALWREGRVYRTNLHNFELKIGESLLVYGKQDSIRLLDSEPDFIVLSEASKEPLRTDKAFVSALIMLAVLLPVLFGFISLAISAIVGVALMVMTGCLKMEEAYRAIEWKAVFLIAGMLPLGTALQKTGAATMIAESVVDSLGPFGPWGIIIGLYLLTTIATFVIPTAALVVLMAPIALQAAATVGISPYAVMMAIAVAASASFTSPISHPANLLVMGPGGYRFIDYIKLGLPLTIVVMIIAFLLIPVFWPL
jgi:di/tricarboxylate transporter